MYFKSHKDKEKFTVVVKVYGYIRPDKKICYTTNNCARDCYNKYFHLFLFRCIYDIETTNGDFATGIISDKKL